MNLVWLRNDLRLDDNPALFEACQPGTKVQVVYTSCDEQWQQHHEAQVKVSFWQETLTDLRSRLSQLGIPLSIIECHSYHRVPDLLAAHCERHEVSDCYFNDEYAVNENKRDEQVEHRLKRLNIRCHRYQSDLLVSEPLLNQQGLPYRVFTPWYRAWIKKLSEDALIPLPPPQPQGNPLAVLQHAVKIMGNSSFRDDLFAPTELEANNRLQSFIRQRLPEYEKLRDFPALNATSTLSPYLSSGLISARRCAYEILQASQLNGVDWRLDPWFRQLGWREFYRYLMLHFQRLSMNKAFIPKTELMRWELNEGYIEAWQKGLTGYPVIDAGMRQMARCGWMHNRLRMLCASFFSKLMLTDWRLGERFFMQSLIDGDFASNNGGWQWSASTGCDASPWFRIFNPYTQSRKFDPDGNFIRKLVPELERLDDKEIHLPSSQACARYNYPAPILDYATSRKRALERFKSTLK
jgi:deoxyribodipyrimidine photo-lyase